MDPKEEKPGKSAGGGPPPPRPDCIKCFDALWFCYSPFHQMQGYYRYGEFDNCFGKWGNLVDCLALKTKRAAEVEAILVAREEARPHIWTYRTVDEATSHWVAMYSHSIKPGDESNHLVEVVRQPPPASVPRRALFPGLAAASAAVPPPPPSPPFPGLVAATAAGPPPSPKFSGS